MTWARDWMRSKTTWTALAAVLAAIASALAGKETFGQAEQQIVVALLGLFVRDTIAKTKETP